MPTWIFAFVLVPTMVSVVVASPRAEVVDVNPPHGDPAYQSWSIFSPDAEKPDSYKDDVIVVFHGFKSAVPNHAYKRIRERFRKTHTVLGVNYDYLDVADTVERLDAFNARALGSRRVVVVGTSLGGFWADYFGNRIGAGKIILINPTVTPVADLSKYIGVPQFNRRRRMSFEITAEAIQSYRTVVRSRHPGTRLLIILTEDDPVQDYTRVREHYRSDTRSKIVLYESGGHTLNLKKHAAMGEIMDFVTSP